MNTNCVKSFDKAPKRLSEAVQYFLINISNNNISLV
nr:MAG TPA: hypothetical protein [Crassvirales sp.]